MAIPARAPLAIAAPRLRVGIEAARDRMEPDFTRFDGNVGVGRVSPFIAEAPMSATRLEAYAKCPRRFLYDRVLQVSKRTLPEEIWQMEPTERGTLVHAILEEYLLERLAGVAAIAAPAPRHRRRPSSRPPKGRAWWESRCCGGWTRRPSDATSCASTTRKATSNRSRPSSSSGPGPTAPIPP